MQCRQDIPDKPLLNPAVFRRLCSTPRSNSAWWWLCGREAYLKQITVSRQPCVLPMSHFIKCAISMERKPDNPSSMSGYHVCTWLCSLICPVYCGCMISLGEFVWLIFLITLGLLHIHQASHRIFQCGHEVILKDIGNFDHHETAKEHSIPQNRFIRDIPWWFRISASIRWKYKHRYKHALCTFKRISLELQTSWDIRDHYQKH